MTNETDYNNPANQVYEQRVLNWLKECFGDSLATDKVQRANRFGEEAIELLQASGCSKADVLALVDYVFSRPVGEVYQEVGGVMLTLAGFCKAYDMDMNGVAEIELRRVWTMVDSIREKEATRVQGSVLPGQFVRLYQFEDGTKPSKIPEGWKEVENFKISNSQDIRSLTPEVLAELHFVRVIGQQSRYMKEGLMVDISRGEIYLNGRFIDENIFTVYALNNAILKHS